ncbi:hypothetical protein [Limnobacter sp.]|uniref:hypothetical protein n=1 Tax=Limnobacter sp. TaxID=2003368 RepID=UPI00311FF543
MDKDNTAQIILGGQVTTQIDIEASEPMDAGAMIALQMLVLPMRDIAKRLPESMRKEMKIGSMVAICVEFGVAYGHEALMAAIKQLEINALREHDLEKAQAQHASGTTQTTTTH